MKRSAGRSRGIGGSGSRGFSRSSGGFKSRSGGFKLGGRTGSGFGSSSKHHYSPLNSHHSSYRRQYSGDSIIPFWVRIIFWLLVLIVFNFLL